MHFIEAFMSKIININLLYIILVFIISTIIIKIDSTLWINVFEVMITMYFTIIYEEIKSMKILSHGVSSCICVETNVILSGYNTRIYRLRAVLGSIPNLHTKQAFLSAFLIQFGKIRQYVQEHYEIMK